jgi:amidase
MSEWANFRSTRSSSGWSARGGQCLNPYALDRSPCGSSSGTGTAIAANLCAVGVGTETDGSVVCPSAAAALVGIKPTLGLVSRAGIIPIAHSQDTAGPMCRTVADAAILLTAMCGPDPRDPATAAARPLGDVARALNAGALRGARIGVARAKLMGYSPATDRVIETALAVLKDAGAVLVDPADVPHVGEYDESEFTVLLYEFKADLNAYLAALGTGARVKTLADVIAFNERTAEREMPYFGQEILTMAQEKGALTDAAYTEALARNQRLSRAEGIDAVMDQHRLDAIVAPTGNPAWPIDLVNGDHFLGGCSTPPAVAGYPHVTVPAGVVRGLPVGLSFIGRAWSDAKLINLAFAYEQASRVRRPPTFRQTADMSAP